MEAANESLTMTETYFCLSFANAFFAITVLIRLNSCVRYRWMSHFRFSPGIVWVQQIHRYIKIFMLSCSVYWVYLFTHLHFKLSAISWSHTNVNAEQPYFCSSLFFVKQMRIARIGNSFDSSSFSLHSEHLYCLIAKLMRQDVSV